MTRRAAILAALLVCLGGFAALAVGGGGGRSHVQRSASRDRYLGRVAPETRVRFGLSLRMRSAALDRYAAAVAAGTRPPLNALQIGARFGASSDSIARVEHLLTTAGVHVDEAFKQRTQLMVSATAAHVERLLGVSLGEFADARGGHYHRPLSRPVIPPALRSVVLSATQLDTKRVPVTQDVPVTGMAGRDLAVLYNLQPLINQGLDGKGQTVAVFSEDTFLESDIAAFDREHHIVGAPPVQRIEVVPGRRVPYTSGDAGGEVDLDTEVIRQLAPKAQILNYEVCCGVEAFTPGIDRIVQDGRAKLVNFSYGICELLLNSALKQADANSLGAAETANVTIFAASGDQGAYECQRFDRADHRLSVGWPGSSPHVVSVGGTYINVRQDGTRLDEFGWEDILIRAGGGGGVSAVFPRPAWQTGVQGIRNQYTTNPPRRQVPDVAADGAFGSPYAVYAGGRDVRYGGTSAAAPFWTGAFVLIDQLAKQRTGRLLPFIAPLLYKVAARDPAAFHDVTLGGNRFYRAGPGWDYSTGLGVPDMAVLAGDIVAAAKRH